MANITGSSSAEIEAPIEQVWEVVQDVEDAPNWQGGLKGLRALERDGEGRAVLCEADNDAKVLSVKSTVRFAYDGPSRLSWRQEKGQLKSVDGSWELEELSAERTRATYALEVDPGRRLGMVVRGPVVDVLRDVLAGARAGELKRRVEEA